MIGEEAPCVKQLTGTGPEWAPLLRTAFFGSSAWQHEVREHVLGILDDSSLTSKGIQTDDLRSEHGDSS